MDQPAAALRAASAVALGSACSRTCRQPFCSAVSIGTRDSPLPADGGDGEHDSKAAKSDGVAAGEEVDSITKVGDPALPAACACS